MSESGAIPLHAWLIMGVALFAVSSAGAVFEMIEDVGGLSKAAWRLQATSLVLLPALLVCLGEHGLNNISAQKQMCLVL